MTNIFNLIKTMVNHNINETYSNDSMFTTGLKMDTITCDKYPQGAIQWLINNKICTLDKVEVIGKGWEKKYVIKFKDFNLDHKFFIKEKRRTLLASQMNKFIDDNHLRSDETKTYSQDRIDNDSLFEDETRYERLSKEDDCTFELFCQSRGFENAKEYLAFMESNPNFDTSILDDMYREFMEEQLACDYEY